LLSGVRATACGSCPTATLVMTWLRSVRMTDTLPPPGLTDHTSLPSRDIAIGLDVVAVAKLGLGAGFFAASAAGAITRSPSAIAKDRALERAPRHSVRTHRSIRRRLPRSGRFPRAIVPGSAIRRPAQRQAA